MVMNSDNMSTMILDQKMIDQMKDLSVCYAELYKKADDEKTRDRAFQGLLDVTAQALKTAESNNHLVISQINLIDTIVIRLKKCYT